MSTIHFHQNMTNGVTVIKNSFIDKYMIHANGEYVKIYLYILRCLEDSLFSASLSLTDFADVFDCTEKDVLRALRYWEQLGLISMTFQADTLTDIRVNELSEVQPAAATEEVFTIPLTKSTSKKKEKTKNFDTSAPQAAVQQVNTVHNYYSDASEDNYIPQSFEMPISQTASHPTTVEQNFNPVFDTPASGYNSQSFYHPSMQPVAAPQGFQQSVIDMPQYQPTVNSQGFPPSMDMAQVQTVSRALTTPLNAEGFDILTPQQNFDVSAIRNAQPTFESHTAQQLTLMQTKQKRGESLNQYENPADVSTERLNQLISDAKVRELLFVAQTYLEKTLSSQETNILLYFYDTLKFSTELIEFLLEYSAGTGHRNLRYIEKVGLTWHEEGIETVQQAKEFTENHSKIYTSILKTFGISGRFLTPVEKNFINKWTNEFGFSLDLILEACNRTIQKIHQPSFPYTDSILTNWHKQTVSNMEDIKRLDSEYKQKQRPQIEQKTSSPAPRKTGFHNFPQQNYNLDELEIALLQRHQ